MSNPLTRYRDHFQGNADALIAAAQNLALRLGLAPETSDGNERLLRHYVSVGVVDKPVREGRDAVYGFRHLVQFLVARRLLADGFPLAKIARYTSVVPTDDLADSLLKTDHASEAELLVAAFRAESLSRVSSDQSRAVPPLASAMGKPPTSRPLPTSAASLGMVDVMQELREMEQRLGAAINALRDEIRELREPHVQHFETSLSEQASDAPAGKRSARRINDRKEVKR